MPMKKGKSKATRNANIKEAMSSIKKKGTFGHSGKKPKAKLRKMAIAAAYATQRKSRGRGK